MDNVIIIGARGFGREVLQYLEDINNISPSYNILGFLDDITNEPPLNGYKILGTVDKYKLPKSTLLFCAIGDPFYKEFIYNKYKKLGYSFLTIIHPICKIGRNVEIGEGSIICPNAILTCNIHIGDMVAININSSIGHDVVINNFSTLSPQSNLNGNVTIGNKVFIGSSTVVIPKISIVDNSYIGAGSVVVKNVLEEGVNVGAPCKKIKDKK